MNAFLTYSLARVGLLVAVFLLLLPVPGLSLVVKAMLAILVTLPLAWFLLRRWRERASAALAEDLRRRRQHRERLRAALAGEDEPEPPSAN